MKNKESSQFAYWIPDSFKLANCDIAPKITENQAIGICNASSAESILKNVLEKFRKLNRKKAYLHWYTGEGMDEMQLIEAQYIVEDLANEYQMYGNCTQSEDEDDCEEEEYAE